MLLWSTDDKARKFDAELWLVSETAVNANAARAKCTKQTNKIQKLRDLWWCTSIVCVCTKAELTVSVRKLGLCVWCHCIWRSPQSLTHGGQMHGSIVSSICHRCIHMENMGYTAKIVKSCCAIICTNTFRNNSSRRVFFFVVYLFIYFSECWGQHGEHYFQAAE